jgi:predicted dehydrogenase
MFHDSHPYGPISENYSQRNRIPGIYPDAMNTSQPRHRKSSRRTLLKTAAVAAIAAPMFIPARALGRDGAVPPSERILLGGIGLGPRGTHDLNWIMGEKDMQFLAICDIRKSRREAVKNLVDSKYGNKDCAMSNNMDEFLRERTDLDAVLIATGDRWHALAAIKAMRAGKDVYCEKPSCMTIAEGQAVADTARRYKRVYQTGTQRLSEGPHVFCYEAAKMGRLGKVHTAYAHIAPWDAAEMRHDWLPAQPEPPLEQDNWDAWLGPCPWRPYNQQYVNGGWRGHYDFHTSCIGEWGAHTFAQAQFGLDILDTNPVEYEYVRNDSGDGMVTHFANGVKMILSRGDKYWHGSCGERFDGPEGWVAAADGYAKPEASNPALMADWKKVVADYTARTGRPMNHMRDFLDCVRTRRDTVANAEVMHRSMATVHAANICMWLKRSIKFDPVALKFNDEEANRLVSRAMREPYII